MARQQSIQHRRSILRRVVTADGRGRAYINGQTVPAQSLRALGERLVDVHGQLEFQSLVRRAHQRETLDTSGNLDADVARVAEACRRWRSLDTERREFEARLQDRDTRLDLLEHYVAELAALDAAPGEAAALLIERTRVPQAPGCGRIASHAVAGRRRRRPRDARAQSVLRGLLPLTPLGGARPRPSTRRRLRREAVPLHRHGEHLDTDPTRQEWLESRLAAMEAVARKHRCEPADSPALGGAAGRAAELRNVVEGRAGLDTRLQAVHREYVERAAPDPGPAAPSRQLDAASRTCCRSSAWAAANSLRAPVRPPELSESGNDDVEFPGQRQS